MSEFYCEDHELGPTGPLCPVCRINALTAERDGLRTDVATWKDMGEKEHALAVMFATEADGLRKESEEWKRLYAEQMGRPCHVAHHEDQEIQIDGLRAALEEMKAGIIDIQHRLSGLGTYYRDIAAILKRADAALGRPASESHFTDSKGKDAP
jgi:hypothetical protein